MWNSIVSVPDHCLWVLEDYQIPSNDDPRLTFDLFMQGLALVLYAFVWENAFV